MRHTVTRSSRIYFLIAIAGLLILPEVVLIAQEQTSVVVDHGVAMKTRDGVILRADVYRPSRTGKFPVLLERTPYDKTRVADFAYQAAHRGYMVVVQDVRGRLSSDGDWYPFKYESADGYDAVEWAAALPGSNGKVGMVGGSYIGATQLLAAIAHPPHLEGICPIDTASNYHENWVYQGGAFEQWFSESWTSLLAQDTFDRVVKRGTNAFTNTTVLPLEKYPVFSMEFDSTEKNTTKQLAPYFLDWLNHPDYDSYWKQWSIEEYYPLIQVPAFTITAWYDIFLGGSLRNYTGMKKSAGTETARAEQRLLVAIGGHAGQGRMIGAVDFGPEAAAYDESALILDWYDYLLQGKQNEFAHSKPVQIFVMGANKWRFEDSWPLTRAKETHYYLHSSGDANTAVGNGLLSTRAPSDERPDKFVYDPANPVPTTGGPLCCDPAHVPAGPRDQRSVESRSDVLVYSTPPLSSDIEVTGPVTLDLFAASSAIDTDFTAKLVDVSPDGFARNLTEGIVRARYRVSTKAATELQPGADYEFTIDLWSTSNVFLKGHRIRLEISSSNFPRFDRNLNTGHSGANSSVYVVATNTILHDKTHPSSLLLPVVP